MLPGLPTRLRVWFLNQNREETGHGINREPVSERIAYLTEGREMSSVLTELEPPRASLMLTCLSMRISRFFLQDAATSVMIPSVFLIFIRYRPNYVLQASIKFSSQASFELLAVGDVGLASLH